MAIDAGLIGELTKEVRIDAKAAVNSKRELFMDSVRDTTKDGLDEHMRSYSAVLSNYTNDLAENLAYKRRSKARLFNTCLFVMVVVVIILFISVLRGDPTLEGCALVVLPFLTTFIVIPKTITEYLFNTKESETISNIVNTIRQHDEKMFELMLGQNNSDEKKKSEKNE